MRPVNSMIEFKQIIGRGTRLFDGKDYFTIHDFVKAYELFSDPDWDGEPVEPEACGKCGNNPCTCEPGERPLCKVCGQRPCVCEKPEPEPCPMCGETPCECEKKKKLKIKLADGKERTIQHMAVTTFWGPDGKPISAAEFLERLYGELPDLFKDEDDLREIWSRPDTRRKLLEALSERGYGREQMAEIKRIVDALHSDIFDVLCYIAFALPAISREERVALSKAGIHAHYADYRQQAFIDFVLQQYVKVGVEELDESKLRDLLELKYQGIRDAATELGSVTSIREVFIGFQQHLYQGGDNA